MLICKRALRRPEVQKEIFNREHSGKRSEQQEEKHAQRAAEPLSPAGRCADPVHAHRRREQPQDKARDMKDHVGAPFCQTGRKTGDLPTVYHTRAICDILSVTNPNGDHRMANDFLTLIKTRRSIRAYKPDAVPADTLARVLEAGTYAPSAMGEQSATIVAVETKAYRDRLTKLNAAVIGRDVDPYYGAPVIVVVLGDGERANYLADGSCVLENLMLAAHAEGLGTVWVNREREIFDSPDGKALLRDWGLPETLRGVGAIALGYAAGPAPEAAPRKENYIVHV